MSKVTAMDPTVESTWVPKCDRDLPEEEQLKIFHYALDMREDAKFNDAQIKSNRKGSHKYFVNQMDIARMEKTIIGWATFNYPSNYPEKDLAGKPVPFSKENIRLLPPEIRQEYITYITGRDKVEEDDDDEGEDLGTAIVD